MYIVSPWFVSLFFDLFFLQKYYAVCFAWTVVVWETTNWEVRCQRHIWSMTFVHNYEFSICFFTLLEQLATVCFDIRFTKEYWINFSKVVIKVEKKTGHKFQRLLDIYLRAWMQKIWIRIWIKIWIRIFDVWPSFDRFLPRKMYSICTLDFKEKTLKTNKNQIRILSKQMKTWLTSSKTTRNPSN